MSKNAPTLADATIREWLRTSKTKHPGLNANWLTKNIAESRKFVLDDSMSAFMADLAYASLMTCTDQDKAQDLMEGMRSLARLPHKATWIEYNMRARAERAVKEYDANIKLGPNDLPDRSGWLCLQHPSLETAFMAIQLSSHCWDEKGQRVARAQPAYIGYMWRCDEGASPWPRFVPRKMLSSRPLEWTRAESRATAVGEDGTVAIETWLTGVSSYRNPNVGIICPPCYMDDFVQEAMSQSNYDVLGEFSSDLRYLWALLATINDLPTSIVDVKQDRGYLARGKMRKFVDHTVVHLEVPAKRYKRLAMHAIAISRRKRHMVRGHFRRNWRQPSERIWVHEHERGDATLGFVLHDYSVERNKDHG